MNSKNIFTFILSACWMLMLSLFSGCTDEYEENGITNGKTATVTLDLLVPGASSGMQTRAMDIDQETKINNLQVLIFEKTASGEELYRQIGKVTKQTDREVTLELPVSKTEYRFVVLANASSQTINDGTPKQQALNQFAFDCAGKWATSGDESLIPMWGEYKEVISIEKKKYIDIQLHRALARVDIGAKFNTQGQHTQTEEVTPLDNFKITSVRVYRTKNKAYVAASFDDVITNTDGVLEVTKPNIPQDATTASDDAPLLYEFKDSPTNAYVREIYIPESGIYETDPTKTSMDEVPCLVIGGFYNKATEESFYRVDFAEYTATNGVSSVSKYLTLLRNHRYAINIQSVSNPGFKDPDHALKSVNVPMVLTVTPWNEIPLNYHLHGDYFYQIDNRDVVLEARTKDETVMPSESVSYTTNLSLSDANVKYSWGLLQDGQKVEDGKDNSDYFDVAFDYGKKTITFTAQKNNMGSASGSASELSDVLNLKVDNFFLTIQVKQKAVNVQYKLMCDETKVHGKYREDVPLNYTHFLEVKINPDLTAITRDAFEEETIEIVSETRKQIYFEFKDTMNQGETDGLVKKNSDGTYTIKLQGNGTPTKDPNDRINPDKDLDGVLNRIDELRINTNSIDGSFCENTTILFGYKTKRLLAIGANAIYRYGYMLEPNTGSRAFVDASINFGVDPNSTVTMEQFPNDYTHPNRNRYDHPSDASAHGNAFHIEYMTAGRGMSGEKINMDYLKKMLKEFKPHIILTGQAINYQSEVIDSIASFVDKGGVFLMFNEYYPNIPNTNAMVAKLMGSDMGGSNVTTSYDNIIYPILGNDENDPILNGPFGDLRGKQWGSDGIALHGFKNVTDQNAIIYSKRVKYDNVPCVFRSKDKPFFYIGDGGFISNASRYIGDSYQGSYVYCPFAIGSAYQPLDRVNYTNDKNQTVVNSRFFGNILTWAVDYAEFHGIKYDID